MKIKSKQFCYLSTSPSFVNWLNVNAVSEYNYLLEEQAKKASCGHNTRIMHTILSRLAKTKSKELLIFLQEHYPYVLEDTKIKDDALINKDLSNSKVFGLYDPTILTFPRRAIVSDLEKFVEGKLIYDYVELDGLFHVEYLNYTDKNLVNSIPDDNWLTKRFKKLNIL